MLYIYRMKPYEIVRIQIRSVEPCAYKKLMKTPLVFDGRNIYDVDLMRLAGVEYHGIGKPRQAGE